MIQTRGLELDYVGTEIAGLELRISFRDRHFPLQVDLHYRLFEDSDVIERRLTLRHANQSDARSTGTAPPPAGS
jgi:alpha-galactosidase